MIILSDLAQAIETEIVRDDQHLTYEDAFDLAQHVLNFFGYFDRIIDNVLEPEDRDAFYMLEDAGILKTEREEITLYDGREWRIHYWNFCPEKIEHIIETGDRRKNNSKDIYEDIYNDPSIWARSAE